MLLIKGRSLERIQERRELEQVASTDGRDGGKAGLDRRAHPFLRVLLPLGSSHPRQGPGGPPIVLGGEDWGQEKGGPSVLWNSSDMAD